MGSIRRRDIFFYKTPFYNFPLIIMFRKTDVKSKGISHKANVKK